MNATEMYVSWRGVLGVTKASWLGCYRPESKNWAPCVSKFWCNQKEWHHSVVLH